MHTAFSGSHQDAIRKGMDAIEKSNSQKWEVPYLPIDPADVGGSYRETVRVNSQSGKGGIAFILENYFGVSLPKALLLEFSPIVQASTEEKGGELQPDDIWQAFTSEFIEVNGPFRLIDYEIRSEDFHVQQCKANILVGDNEIKISGEGSGPIDAFVNGLVNSLNEPLNVIDYQEYALNEGKEAQAICILAISDEKRGSYYGVGISQNTITAAYSSIIAAINRKWVI